MRYLLIALGVIVTTACLQACNNQNDPEKKPNMDGSPIIEAWEPAGNNPGAGKGPQQGLLSPGQHPDNPGGPG